MAEIISALFTGAISVALYVYVSFTVRCKGPVLSNTYLFASKEERKKMDIKAEYHLVSVIFSLLATSFAFTTVYILTDWKWCLYVVFVLIICVIVYAVRDAVKTERNR